MTNKQIHSFFESKHPVFPMALLGSAPKYSLPGSEIWIFKHSHFLLNPFKNKDAVTCGGENGSTTEIHSYVFSKCTYSEGWYEATSQ